MTLLDQAHVAMASGTEAEALQFYRLLADALLFVVLEREAEGERYAELIGEVRPLPRARELLKTLDEQGTIVVLASSCREEELEHYLDLLDDVTGEMLEEQTNASQAVGAFLYDIGPSLQAIDNHTDAKKQLDGSKSV